MEPSNAASKTRRIWYDSLNGVAPFAFVASWAHSLRLLPDRFPVLQDQGNSLVTSSNHASDIGLTLEHHLKDISKLSNLLPNTKKLQHQSKADQLIETDSNRDAARLLSIRGKGARAWLDSIPSSEKFALSSGNYLSWRLLSDWVYLCLYRPGPLNVNVESH